MTSTNLAFARCLRRRVLVVASVELRTSRVHCDFVALSVALSAINHRQQVGTVRLHAVVDRLNPAAVVLHFFRINNRVDCRHVFV